MATPAFVTIPDSDVDPESPITTALMQALRDNPLSIAGRGTSAPDSIATHITDDVTTLKMKVIEIGDWNMVADLNKTVAHGLTLSTIRGFTVNIRHDVTPGGFVSCFPALDHAGTTTEIANAEATNFSLSRADGGFFDDTSFDDTSYNRGWITVWYVG